MQGPQIFLYDQDGDEDGAATSLAEHVADLGFAAPFVVRSIFGERLAARLTGPGEAEIPVPGADQAWAERLGARAHSAGADVVVAVGGGRCLDVAKLAAARLDLSLVAVPTQLSHDGICSPVAVVPDGEGRAESTGAAAPIAVYLSLPTLMTAPLESVRAGLGDLLANPLALKDWELAIREGHEEPNERARELSVRSFELIAPYLDTNPEAWVNEPKFFVCLADALVLSGLAMIEAGTSRPASGGEHEISHAIDRLYGGRAMHGAQVAFGTIITASLYGEDHHAWRARIQLLGLPHDPSVLALDTEDLVAILLAAPGTRPDRFTILEHAGLDEDDWRALIADIWGPSGSRH